MREAIAMFLAVLLRYREIFQAGRVDVAVADDASGSHIRVWFSGFDTTIDIPQPCHGEGAVRRIVQVYYRMREARSAQQRLDEAYAREAHAQVEEDLRRARETLAGEEEARRGLHSVYGYGSRVSSTPYVSL